MLGLTNDLWRAGTAWLPVPVRVALFLMLVLVIVALMLPAALKYLGRALQIAQPAIKAILLYPEYLFTTAYRRVLGRTPFASLEYDRVAEAVVALAVRVGISLERAFAKRFRFPWKLMIAACALIIVVWCVQPALPRSIPAAFRSIGAGVTLQTARVDSWVNSGQWTDTPRVEYPSYDMPVPSPSPTSTKAMKKPRPSKRP